MKAPKEDSTKSNKNDANKSPTTVKESEEGNNLDINIDAVITISPRRDHSDFDDDLRESLVTCTIQV